MIGPGFAVAVGARDALFLFAILLIGVLMGILIGYEL